MVTMLLSEKMVPPRRLSFIFVVLNPKLPYFHCKDLTFFFCSVLWQNYTDYVGKKSTFRLLNRGSAKALDKVVELDGIVHPASYKAISYLILL